jgi:hypothetical protein
MLRQLRILAVFAAFLGFGVLGVVTPARASFTLTLRETGFSDMVVTDGGANDMASGAGQIVYVGAFGHFAITLDTATTTNGTPLINTVGGRIQVTANVTRDGTPGDATLELLLSDDSFTAPFASGHSLDFSSQIATTGSAGTIAFQSTYTDAGNNVVLTNPLVTLPAVGNEVHTTLIRDGATYTLASDTQITLGALTNAAITGTTTVNTPAPGSLVLALAGLPLFGMVGWLRRRRL